ncbi:MAG: SDR family oxidoreductase [Chlamydiales bacterium]|nr:SDR family oxidoreductase [Chlamydiales bacterium]
MSTAALVIGCGYIGSALAQAWAAQGVLVTATTTTPGRLTELEQIAHKAVLLDFKDEDQLLELLQGHDWIVVSVAAKDSSSYQETYLYTAQALVKSMEQAPNVSRVIYTSSTSVYGEHDGDWVDEETPLTPISPQAKILAQTEEVLSTLPNACIMRLGEIIGPGRDIVERLQKQVGRTLPGTGQNFTNLSHRDDIVNAIMFAAEHGLSGIYNACNDLHITRKQLYDAICARMGWPEFTWDPTQKTMHGGNKRVTSDKIHKAGLNEFLKLEW